MSERFFVETPIRGAVASLIGQEATHLCKVLRARVGDPVLLFDGLGSEYSARVQHLERHSVGCEILGIHSTEPEPTRRVEFGVALPKGDRQRLVVEKLTELGVTSLVPLLAQRSVAQPDEQTVERLRRAVIEASKQCGRNRLMEIQSPVTLSDWLAADAGDSWRLIAHPGAPGTEVVSARDLASRAGTGVRLAVGPEGGFTDEEIVTAERLGWSRISLGTRILRVETAAMALATLASL